MFFKTSSKSKIVGKNVVVVGSMNCMPTEYSIVLAELGANVIHYYDAEPNDSLSNPLLRYPTITKVKNLSLKKLKCRHTMHFIASRLLHSSITDELKSADIVILSGPAISLARFLKRNRVVIAIGYGDDISAFCNPEWPFFNFKRRSLFQRIMFGWILFLLQKYFVCLQRRGLSSSTIYSYFIPGLDIRTDLILSNLIRSNKPTRVSRYSISTKNVPELKDSLVKKIDARLKVIFPVRFSSSSVMFADKGWRNFINYANSYIEAKKKDFEAVAFICFNKGDQVDEAKIALKALSIDRYFHWFDVVPFHDLYSMMNDSDVVVDQLGDQWVGVGLWGGLLGKPVICNLSTKAKRDMFRDSYFLHASNREQFCDHLSQCESLEFVNGAKKINPLVVNERFSIEKEIDQWLNL